MSNLASATATTTPMTVATLLHGRACPAMGASPRRRRCGRASPMMRPGTPGQLDRLPVPIETTAIEEAVTGPDPALHKLLLATSIEGRPRPPPRRSAARHRRAAWCSCPMRASPSSTGDTIDAGDEHPHARQAGRSSPPITRSKSFSFGLRGGIGRACGNAFRQRRRSRWRCAFDAVPHRSLEELGTPAVASQLLAVPYGLVLVVGPTGSGKSTTLAAMIDRINSTRPCHILTIEDPSSTCTSTRSRAVNQREVGTDVATFPDGLRSGAA